MDLSGIDWLEEWVDSFYSSHSEEVLMSISVIVNMKDIEMMFVVSSCSA